MWEQTIIAFEFHKCYGIVASLHFEPSVMFLRPIYVTISMKGDNHTYSTELTGMEMLSTVPGVKCVISSPSDYQGQVYYYKFKSMSEGMASRIH